MHSSMPLPVPLTGDPAAFGQHQTVIIPPPPKPRHRRRPPPAFRAPPPLSVVLESRFGSGFEDGYADVLLDVESDERPFILGPLGRRLSRWLGRLFGGGNRGMIL